jgi:hypothetical protein
MKMGSISVSPGLGERETTGRNQQLEKPLDFVSLMTVHGTGSSRQST